MLRFVPSPTGDMHIGNLRVAILNYLAAKVHNEAFLIRIDDNDKEKIIEGKDTEIMQIMEKFALKHDEVYHQSEHHRMHQTLALRLLQEDKAFICTCEASSSDLSHTEENQCSGQCLQADKERLGKLKAEGRPFVIRIKAPQEEITTTDLIRGDITTAAEDIESFIILKSDGTPARTFATACDDMLGSISLIIRESDLLSESPKEHHIKSQLGYTEETDYIHLPPLISSTGEPIIEITIKRLFEEGFLPDAIINYLLLLDCPGAPEEIFTLPEAIRWFKLEDLSTESVRFDIEQLRKINRAHLMMMDDKRLSTLFGFADADIGKLAKLYLGDASTINALEAKFKPIFAPKPFEKECGKEMRLLQEIIAEAPMINDFESFKSYLLQKSGLDEAQLDKPLRLLLTGTPNGPQISEIYPYIKPYLLEVAS